MTVDEMLAVLQAHKEGKVIEYRHKAGYSWGQDEKWAVTKLPTWSFHTTDYRVKPEPMEYKATASLQSFHTSMRLAPYITVWLPEEFEKVKQVEIVVKEILE